MSKESILSGYRGMKVLVTGGAGAIGSHLVSALLDLGASVAVFDNLSSGHRNNLPSHPRLAFYPLDIVDSHRVRDQFADLKPEVVFNLAAHYANLKSIEEPNRNLEVNVAGLLTLLQAAVWHGVRRFIQASSSCVYAPDSPLPLTEESPIRPSTPYGISKALAEDYCRFYQEYYGLDITILRYFNSYGPGDYPGKYRGVVPNMFYDALTKRELTITGTGEETREFTFVKDIVLGSLLAGIVPEARDMTFNLGSGEEITINRLAQIISKTVGGELKINYAPRRSWDKVIRRVASINRATKYLGYQPQYSLEEGVALTCQWFKAQMGEGVLSR